MSQHIPVGLVTGLREGQRRKGGSISSKGRRALFWIFGLVLVPPAVLIVRAEVFSEGLNDLLAYSMEQSPSW